MSIDNAIRKRAQLFGSVGGKTAANIRYPNEIELYVCAFELLDGEGKTLKYFLFPIMPSSIDESHPTATNIKATLGGMSVLKTTNFIARSINLSGNFGRKFKILLGDDYQDFLGSFTDNAGKLTQASFANGLTDFFDERVKTGYGCLKVLEDIITQANVLDDKGPRTLIFYNQAFGSAYVVEPGAFRISMSQESNMIHNYSLQLTAVADINALRSQKQRMDDAIRLDVTGRVQTMTNNLVTTLSSILVR